MRAWHGVTGIAGAVVVVQACYSTSTSGPTVPQLTQEQLQEATLCQTCHGSQYTEWASSMHAYAAADPVFLAMNARGQRETNGALGSFCVQCHAPMAVRLGLTTDGLNLATLPASVKGVTCYFCHVATAATNTNDAPISLASDGVMRAAISDPAPGAPHAASYFLLQDGKQIESSQFCGSCHDVTNQHGVAIETTFAEWVKSEFSHVLSSPDNTRSCPACHMPTRQAQAATSPATSPIRDVHDHSMAGVDLALVPFPGTAQQQTLVQQQLDAAVTAKLCVSSGSVQVTLESENVGHSWPSGAIQDRRAWLELVAKSAGQVVFQTGVVADNQSIMTLSDPNLFLLREPMLDGSGNEVRFLWQARSIGTTSALPAATSIQGPGAVHSVTRTFSIPTTTDAISARVRIVAIEQGQLDDLVSSGDLDPAVRAAMPVISLAGTTVTWSAGGPACVP